MAAAIDGLREAFVAIRLLLEDAFSGDGRHKVLSAMLANIPDTVGQMGFGEVAGLRLKPGRHGIVKPVEPAELKRLLDRYLLPRIINKTTARKQEPT